MAYGSSPSTRGRFPNGRSSNIAYYPRIFDLAHRFLRILGLTYVAFAMQIYCLNEGRFSVVHVESDFHAPLRYGMLFANLD